MHNGTITDNTAIRNGGGVYIPAGGNFTMHDGTISGNTARNNGGGVCILGYMFGSYSYFTMQGGIITGNTAGGNGGGLYFQYLCIFTKTDGTIYGSNETDVSLRNTAEQGAAVISGSRWRNSTAGPSMNTDTYGFWLND